jgi:hypothetical protein
MSVCSEFDNAKFVSILRNLDESNPSDQVLDTLKTMSTENCPISGGKRNGKGKRKGKRTRRLRGGQVFSRRNIKVVIYLVIAALSALAIGSPNASTIAFGLQMLISGQCGNLGNRLWGFIGLENPVCRMYNVLLNVVLQSLSGDAMAISQLVGLVTMIAGGPYAAATAIDSVAARIENSVASRFAQIENGAANNDQPVIAHAQIIPNEDWDAANSLVALRNSTPRGGKTKRHRKRGGKKTKSHRRK